MPFLPPSACSASSSSVARIVSPPSGPPSGAFASPQWKPPEFLSNGQMLAFFCTRIHLQSLLKALAPLSDIVLPRTLVDPARAMLIAHRRSPEKPREVHGLGLASNFLWLLTTKALQLMGGACVMLTGPSRPCHGRGLPRLMPAAGRLHDALSEWRKSSDSSEVLLYRQPFLAQAAQSRRLLLISGVELWSPSAKTVLENLILRVHKKARRARHLHLTAQGSPNLSVCAHIFCLLEVCFLLCPAPTRPLEPLPTLL